METRSPERTRILVDESTGRRLCDLLGTFHDVQYAGDIMSAAPDEEILEYADRSGRILITDDKDFGELVFRLEKPTKGVILLRMPYDPKKRLEAINNLIRKASPLKDKFVVLEEKTARIRTIASRR